MEEITLNVSELAADERRALEVTVGHALADSQQLVIRVLTPKVPDAAAAKETVEPENGLPILPEWFNVFEGLSEQEADELEAEISQRANLTRFTD